MRAYLLVGAVWGLWHAPLILIGFNYPGYPVAGILMMMAFTTVIGIYINEKSLRYRSSILAGSIHGAINGQAYGVWRVLFPTVHPLWGGVAGVVGLAVWLALGLWVGAQTVARGSRAGYRTNRRFHGPGMTPRPRSFPGQAAQ